MRVQPDVFAKLIRTYTCPRCGSSAERIEYTYRGHRFVAFYCPREGILLPIKAPLDEKQLKVMLHGERATC